MKSPIKTKARPPKKAAKPAAEKRPEPTSFVPASPYKAPPPATPSAIWKAKRVCEFLAISRDTLDRWVKAGKVPSPSWNGRLRIWASDAIQDVARQMLSVQTRQPA